MQCFFFLFFLVSTSAVGSQLSPYLSIDPSYLQNQPEFISLEGARPRRGRFEMAFSQIGGELITDNYS